ncbi:hypothetical protein KIN20_000529 [Parelaphostrongylus tenuis]|uniref:TOG domain-containing protein n=1 Tax=Parelaphostrongylus tenuis TaxID=148309 RepID=A0AAD5QBX2_PARTN|nr:hypothetical protein KIN20_000529 [Parelaphostrongylus tenuis]
MHQHNDYRWPAMSDKKHPRKQSEKSSFQKRKSNISTEVSSHRTMDTNSFEELYESKVDSDAEIESFEMDDPACSASSALMKQFVQADHDDGMISSEVRAQGEPEYVDDLLHNTVLVFYSETQQLSAARISLPTCERVIYDFFSVNSEDFSTILSSYPEQWRQFAYGLIDKNKPGVGDTATEQRSPASVGSSLRETVRGDILSQNADFVDRRGGLKHYSSYNELLESSVAYDDDLNFSDVAELESTICLKDDAQLQNKYIASLLKELSTLDPLRRMSRIMLFKYCNKCDAKLKRNALKLLQKICVAQAATFGDLVETTLSKLLNSNSEGQNQHVMTTADECLKTLATHFPRRLVIQATKPILSQENDPRVGPALKMLTRLIESIDAGDVLTTLPEIAREIVNCYSSPHERS